MSVTTYDRALRRPTPLAEKLKVQIAAGGPISVSAYMAACLLDPDHGYYTSRNAIGRDGDFITAPEISQMFGEVLGLWAAVVWQQMGEPAVVRLIEIGPGRGTMMRDMIRAISSVPGFARAVRIELIEASPRLAAIQAEALRDGAIPVRHVVPVRHAIPMRNAMPGAPSAISPDAPTILIANEVLDCIPVDQIVRHIGDDGMPRWHHRTVACDTTGALQFGIGAEVKFASGSGSLEAMLSDASPDAIWEANRTRQTFEAMARDYAHVPLAALFIDYGHDETCLGETVQAVRNHAYEDPLTSPGEADLTAQVDFAQVSAAARHAGFAVDGPVPQAEFLGQLGLVERASRLMAANPSKASEVEVAAARLMAPSGMGTRFKAIGIRSPGLPQLPGFAT